jgi:hypothetical protein
MIRRETLYAIRLYDRPVLASQRLCSLVRIVNFDYRATASTPEGRPEQSLCLSAAGETGCISDATQCRVDPGERQHTDVRTGPRAEQEAGWCWRTKRRGVITRPLASPFGPPSLKRPAFNAADARVSRRIAPHPSLPLRAAPSGVLPRGVVVRVDVVGVAIFAHNLLQGRWQRIRRYISVRAVTTSSCHK